jgi:prevent-host-death family protein
MPMEKSISAADANRNFSKLLQGVRRGRSFVVTSHGQPVATIAPVKSSSRAESAARAMLFKRLREQPVIDIGSWRRDELYEDGA